MQIQVLGSLGDGKTTIALLIADALREAGIAATIVDDEPEEDSRTYQTRRITAVAKNLLDKTVVIATVAAKRAPHGFN